ncbi:Predicted membrane protein [Serratia rubidaea]|uniref:Predicted membrane protein n=1 Tax=Serratia rubidaea TaxID=61652 RepID=A0A4U9HAF1_SERRU|nr:Predicted membrane protein [Serratia rubidaea]
MTNGALIKENNQSAAFGFVGACLGYVIPLASAAVNSVSLLDYVIWGAVALVVQLLLFAAVKVYMPRISDKIEANHLAAGIFLGGVSISGGVLNAACMTY